MNCGEKQNFSLDGDRIRESHAKSVNGLLHRMERPVNYRVHWRDAGTHNYLKLNALILPLIGWSIALTQVFLEPREREDPDMHSFAWWPTVAALCVATFTDLHSRRIPNWLVFPFLASGFAVSGLLYGWHGIVLSFEGAAVALAFYGFLFWMGGMGAGDVKLCVAIGGWIGPSQLFIALAITSMAGGIMVLTWAAFGGFLKELFSGASSLAFAWKDRGGLRDAELSLSNPLRRKMPYAPAIAIGTLISFFAH